MFESEYLLDGFEEHRERMSEVRKEIQCKDYAIYQMEADFAGSEWASPKTCDFVYFVRDCYTPQERLKMKKKLMLCHCCSRHSHYKDLKHKPDHPVPESKIKECKCSCRHYARIFKRTNLA